MCGGLILEGDRTEVRSPLFSKMDLLYGYSGTFSYLCRITRLNGMQGYCRKTCAALLLILFAGYWGSVTLFPHAHHVDGFVIVHSHPFSGAANGFAPLNHTPQQFQLIAHLSLLVMVAAVALSFAARLLGVRYVFRMMRPVGCLRPAIRTCSLRAPPVC